MFSLTVIFDSGGGIKQVKVSYFEVCVLPMPNPSKRTRATCQSAFYPPRFPASMSSLRPLLPRRSPQGPKWRDAWQLEAAKTTERGAY